MMHKPTTSSGYPIGLAVQARRMCLYVATLLGDLKDDVVVVGLRFVEEVLVDLRHADHHLSLHADFELDHQPCEFLPFHQANRLV